MPIFWSQSAICCITALVRIDRYGIESLTEECLKANYGNSSRRNADSNRVV
jgi:hypothetical protein